VLPRHTLRRRGGHFFWPWGAWHAAPGSFSLATGGAGRETDGMGYSIRVKICGVMTERDARLAGLLGADAVGLNFFPQSPRFVAPQACTSILRELPPFVEAVGLFVEQPLRHAFQTLNQLGRMRTIQWYGRQRELCDAYPFQVIHCFPVRDQQSLLDIVRYVEMCRSLGQLPAAVLVDASIPGQHGGTGRTLPWALLSEFRPGVPLILAGGLTPDNVAEAIRIVRPYGVDVASGVETVPGHKDPEKMRRFIAAAREASAKYRPSYGPSVS
jgi:phosphoribosylanthranilate isomerase